MKILKLLMTYCLIFSLGLIQVGQGTITLNTLLAQETNEVTPEQTPKPTLDYRNSEKDVGNLSMNQIMVILTLLVGPYIGMQCWGEISGKIFAAGGVIYLVQEVMNYDKYKKASTSNQEMYATLDNETEDAQIEAFTYAEQQELTAADALKSKAGAVQTLMIATTLAAVVALIEGITDYYGWVSGYNSSCYVNAGDPSKYKNYADVQITPIQNESMAQYFARSSEMNDFYFTDAVQSPNTYNQTQATLIDSVIDRTTQTQMIQMIASAMSFAGNLVMPSAFAKSSESSAKDSGVLSSMGVLSAIAGGILAAVGTASTPILSTILANGFSRAATFGVLAGFQMAAKAEISKGEEKLRDNAKVYATLRDRLMQALNTKTRFAGINGPKNAFKNRLAAYASIRDEMNAPDEGAICLTGNAGEKRVDTNCECRKNNTCAKASFAPVTLKGQNLPGFYGSSLDTLGQGASSLYAGNTAAANSSFASLNQNAANLRNLHKSLRNKSDELLQKGKNKTNMNAIEADVSKKLQELYPTLIKNLSPQQQQLAQGLGAGLGIEGTGVASEKLAKVNDSNLAALAQDIKVNGDKNKDEKDPMAEFNFDFQTEEDKSGQKVAMLEKQKTLGDFVTNESDISNRPSESIFKIITVRYFKSAYPRFFNNEKKDLD